MARLAIALLLVFALVLAGCGGSGQPAASPSQSPPAPEAPKKAEPTKQADADALYSKIEPGMNYDEVMQIMADHKPLMTSEGTIDTPSGKITTNNVSWRINKSLITVIFQDGKVLSKDLTKLP